MSYDKDWEVQAALNDPLSEIHEHIDRKLNMDIVTEKYVRKPLYVDAVQVTAENFVDVANWCQSIIVNNDGTPVGDVNPGGQHIYVRVHNPKTPRQTKAFVGDWILYTERGYKIYTQKAFKASFEPLTGVEADKAVQAGKVQAVRKQVGVDNSDAT